MAHSANHRVQRDGHSLLMVETRQDDGSRTFEIADGRAIVPFGVSVIYDPGLPAPNQLKIYTPASWSAGLLAEDIRCVLAMLAEAADRADTLSSTC